MSETKTTKQRKPIFVAAKLVEDMNVVSAKLDKARGRLADTEAELAALVKAVSSQPQEVQDAVSRLRQPAAK